MLPSPLVFSRYVHVRRTCIAFPLAYVALSLQLACLCLSHNLALSPPPLTPSPYVLRCGHLSLFVVLPLLLAFLVLRNFLPPRVC